MNEINPNITGNIIPDNTYQPLKTGRICLFDADFFKYLVTDRRYKMLADTGDFINEFTNEYETVEMTIKNLISSFLGSIQDPIIFCFSGKSFLTFRNYIGIERKYKISRLKPKEYRDYPGKNDDKDKVVSYVNNHYVSLMFADLEADDILSALQDNDNTYILSHDKDLKQIPGYHYDFERNNIYQITQETAIYNLGMQLLMGDSTDDIVGIPGIGEAKAKEILQNVSAKNIIHKVQREYKKRFGIITGTDMFAENWMLVKTRMNRGTHFINEYKRMFDTKNLLIEQLKSNQNV